MRIAVVGGGNAGFISALVLKTRFPDYQVDIIHSKKMGIIGVGEGSTEHWQDFMQFVGIDTYRMIKECDATFKIGIMFKNWGVPDYMHSIQDGYNYQLGQYPHIYAKLIADGGSSRDLSSPAHWENKVETWYYENNRLPVAQYHFNTFKLNEFLTKVAIDRGITIYDDEIVDATLTECGNIDEIIGQGTKYKYDFYIDCTGFKKMLISKVGGKWNSHAAYLKTNSSIVFQTPDTDNYNMWSEATALDSGWLFRTPTYGRWGNGYIYDDEFLTPEQAKAEVEKFLGHEITVGRHIKFEPGAIDRAWIKNCVAIGLSSSFVEPLEASSIGTSIQQVFLLMHRIVNYDDDVINKYNKSVSDVVYNIRDFITLHFINPRRDTPFWRKVAAAEIPETLKHNLKVWKNKLPIQEDFSELSEYILFKSLHFLMILQGLGIFDVEKIKNEFESYPKIVKDSAVNAINDIREFYKTTKYVSHKEMLEKIRNSI